MTPVTAETFAAWKRNRLDKKEVEAEALRKVKAQTAAAGKSSGLSGRDLASLVMLQSLSFLYPLTASSNLIRRGFKMMMMMLVCGLSS